MRKSPQTGAAAMPQSQSITVKREEDQALLDRHLANGRYESPSKVPRVGLHALDHEPSGF